MCDAPLTWLSISIDLLQCATLSGYGKSGKNNSHDEILHHNLDCDIILSVIPFGIRIVTRMLYLNYVRLRCLARDCIRLSLSLVEVRKHHLNR
jgi:hypothetical protein